MLKQYIRRNKKEISPRKKVIMSRRHKVGVLLGEKYQDGFRVGWSLCKSGKDGDTFTVSEGEKLAAKRMKKTFDPDEVPHSIKGEMMDFVERCKHYFK